MDARQTHINGPAASQINAQPARRSNKAFTLVELLVVIAIIVVLVAILLPALTKAHIQAQIVACASNVRQLCSAQLMYANDNNGWFMDVGNNDGSFNNQNHGGAPYAPNSPYKLCLGAMDQWNNIYGLHQANFFCPSNLEYYQASNFPDANGYSYAGYQFFGGQANLGGTVGNIMSHGYTQPDEIPTVTLHCFPRRMGWVSYYNVMVTDLTMSDSNGNMIDVNSNSTSNHLLGGVVSAGYLPTGQGGCNVGYSDGHVEWHIQNELGQTHNSQTGLNSPFLPRFRNLCCASIMYGNGNNFRYFF